MTSRTPPVTAAMGSRARSVESYYPFYPPPVWPEGLERGGYSGFGNNAQGYLDERTDKGIVHSGFMRQGERTRYTFGGVIMKVFRMLATGQVESSRANPVLNFPHVAMQNDWLYRAAKGYPRNLGLSEKVPTLPDGALNGTNSGTMQPRPQFRRNVFTHRNFSTAPSVPAQPQSR